MCKNFGNNRIKISILKRKWGKCVENPHEISGKGRGGGSNEPLFEYHSDAMDKESRASIRGA